MFCWASWGQEEPKGHNLPLEEGAGHWRRREGDSEQSKAHTGTNHQRCLTSKVSFLLQTCSGMQTAEGYRVLRLLPGCCRTPVLRCTARPAHSLQPWPCSAAALALLSWTRDHENGLTEWASGLRGPTCAQEEKAGSSALPREQSKCGSAPQNRLGHKLEATVLLDIMPVPSTAPTVRSHHGVSELRCRGYGTNWSTDSLVQVLYGNEYGTLDGFQSQIYKGTGLFWQYTYKLACPLRPAFSCAVQKCLRVQQAPLSGMHLALFVALPAVMIAAAPRLLQLVHGECCKSDTSDEQSRRAWPCGGAARREDRAAPVPWSCSPDARHGGLPRRAAAEEAGGGLLRRQGGR